MSQTSTVRYEVLILTAPDITQDVASALEKHAQDLISSAQGKVISFDRWGKYKLAYAVRNQEYGVYYLMRFELPRTNVEIVLKDLRSLLAVKYNDTISRHLINALQPGASLEYKRPESLEEAPRRDDNTVREHRGRAAASNSAVEHDEDDVLEQEDISEDAQEINA